MCTRRREFNAFIGTRTQTSAGEPIGRFGIRHGNTQALKDEDGR